MEPKLKLPGHPDGVFGGGDKGPWPTPEGMKEAAALIAKMGPQPMLTEEVNALAASFNIQATPTGNNPYEPDAFIAAIRRTHDTLLDVKRQLTEQHAKQAAQAEELKAREMAVTFREKRVHAMETMAAKPKWWRL
jgi:hypothetical protein